MILRREDGQAMVEAIWVFPLLLIVLLAMVQLAELVVTMMAANWAARMSARVLAVRMNDESEPMERAEAAALQILIPFLPPVPGTGELEAGLAPVFRWMARTGMYQVLPLRPLTLTGSIEFEHGAETLANAGRYLQAGERGNAVVNLSLWYPLRIPLGNRFFADASVTTATVRKISARAQFPVMYAPRR